MKLVLNSIFLIIFFLSSPLLGGVYFKEYIIYTSGIKIGELNWELKIKNKVYSNNIKLKSSGILSTLYNFEGSYFSSGSVKNKTLTAKNYNHNWKTNKVNKTMSLIFNNNKLDYLEQIPLEKEQLRFDIYKINEVKDPLSSFLQIIYGSDRSLVVDGRRLYMMNATHNKKVKKTIIDLTEYSNLWADHKKSDFEKITFERNDKELLPTTIFIYFDGRIFKIKEG